MILMTIAVMVALRFVISLADDNNDVDNSDKSSREK